MLSESQIGNVWEDMINAEARALYFADLACRYTREKQILTGVSFFTSSAAAASVLGKLPAWVSIMLALISAVGSAYSIAVGLDRKIGTMAKLHSAWSQIATDYDRLWNHTYEESAESECDQIAKREREASELASTEAPNDEQRMAKWQNHVFRMRHLTEQHG